MLNRTDFCDLNDKMNGKGMPNALDMVLIAEVLDVTVEDLVDIEFVNSLYH